jgi:hypothetical protein
VTGGVRGGIHTLSVVTQSGARGSTASGCLCCGDVAM